MADMRDRLIDLLYRAHHNASCVLAYDGDEEKTIEEEARYLLANGVILPPCKVGDTVYRKNTLTVQKEKVIAIEVDEEGVFVGTKCATYQERHFGKFVFLTREEAEKALREKEK